jgi:biotin carboxylase
MGSLSVLIVEPESSGLGLIEAAARLGFQVHVMDRHPLDTAPRALARAVSSGVARHLRAETRDMAQLRAAALALAETTDLVAVIPGFEYAVEASAMVAAELGLRGLDPDAASAVRDKGSMKQRLRAAGVPVAAGWVLPPAHEVESAVARAVFPAVVKPVDGAGSVLVRRVDGPRQMREHVELARHRPVDDMGKMLGRTLLVEAYVPGPEYSVEGLVTSGEVIIAAVTEKRLGPEPHFVEVGHVVEASLDPADRGRVEEVADAALRALGVSVGGFHVEVRLGPCGPVVMEVAARLGGDRIPALVAVVRGIDLHEATVRSFTGLPVPDRSLPARAGVAAVRFFTVGTTSWLLDPVGLTERIRRVVAVEEVEVYLPAGSRLVSPTDFRQRFGHAVLAAEDRVELETRLVKMDHIVGDAVARGVDAGPAHQQVG